MGSTREASSKGDARVPLSQKTERVLHLALKSVM